MKMPVQPRQTDNVFLLTLVDFLIQVIFFGVFIFIVYQAIAQQEQQRYGREEVDRAVETAGVSSLTELTDELSKLAPVRLKGLSSALGDNPDANDIQKATDAIRNAGGAAGVSEAMDRLARLERGSDLPPCISEVVDGQRRAITLASAVGSGSTISFESETPQLATLLSEVGLTYGAVRSLGLREFRRVFQPVLERHPSCRYTIVLRETTRTVDARDAAGQIFYLRIRR